MKVRSATEQAGKSLVAIPILLVVLIAAALLMRTILSVPRLPARATVLPTPAPLAEFLLATHDGGVFTRDSLRDHWSMIFFGFTNCPDICPITLHQLVSARAQMATSDAGAALPEIVFISVDPDRDSADALKLYARSFGEGISGVRGDPDELARLTEKLGIYFKVTKGNEQEYLVEHSAAVIIINENAEFHALFSAPHDAAAIANDMRLIMASK